MLAYRNFKLIPAPSMSYTKVYDRTEDGTIVGSSFTVVLKGEIAADRGSPNGAGVFWDQPGYPANDVLAADANGNMTAIMRKQEAIRKLFSVQGGTLELLPWDGMQSMKCNPIIKSIQFLDQDASKVNWFNKCDYIIEMECDTLTVAGGIPGEDDFQGFHVKTASETWDIEPTDENAITFRLTHSISAVGKTFYDNTGTQPKKSWEYAKDFVLQFLGLGLVPDRMNAPGVLDASFQAYDYLRYQTVNELTGNFAVKETFLCWVPDGPPAIDEFTVDAKTGEDGRTRVSLSGSLKGLKVSDNNTGSLISSKYENALLKWLTVVQPALFARAEAISGFVLNPLPIALSRSDNDLTGVIGYSAEFDDRPIAIISGAVRESIAVTDDHPQDLFASINIPMRAAGPLLQNMLTKSSSKRSISIEVTLQSARLGFTPSQPNTNALVLSLRPTAAQIFVSQDTENFVANQGKYSRNVVYTWE